jgi:hypothetical protein
VAPAWLSTPAAGHVISSFHFLLVGPDSISSVNLSGWGFVFIGTAIFLAATEVWGVSAAIRLLRVAVRVY